MRTTAQEIELIANFYAKEGETDLLKTAIETLVEKVGTTTLEAIKKHYELTAEQDKMFV